MIERIRAPDSSSGVSDQQSVGSSPGYDSCVLTPNCYYFVLQMGCKAVGPMCSVTYVKEPSVLIEKEKGLTLVFLV